MTLLQRVLLLALPLLVAVSGVSGWVGVGWVESEISRRSKVMLEDFAALQVEKLGDELRLARSQLRLVAADPGVIAAARDALAGENLHLKLAEAQSNDPLLAELEVLAADGRRIVSIADAPELNPDVSKDFLAKLKRNTDVIDISVDAPENFLIIAQAIRDDGRIVGMLTARIPLASLNSIINATHNGMTTVETLWLVETDVHSPRLLSTPHLANSGTVDAQRETGEFGKLIKKSLRGVHSFTDNVADYRNEPVIAISSYSPDTGWGLVVKADQTEIFQTLKKFRNFTLLSVAVTALLSMLALALILRSVTQPLKKLTRDAMQLAELSGEQPLPIHSKNELEVLQDVHIRMHQHLRDAQQRLHSEVEEKTANLRDANDQLVKLNHTLIDTQSRAKETEARLNLALNASMAGIWEWRSTARDQVWMSARCRELLGQAETGSSNYDANTFTALLDYGGTNTSAAMREALDKGDIFQRDVYLKCGELGRHWFKLAAAATLSADGRIEHIAGSVTDIQALKDAEQEVHQLVSALEDKSRTDSLTGLANRRYFNETLDEELARARRYDHAISALVIDADNFKAINDAHGHLTGDDVLVTLAQTIKQGCRPVDFACRFGGEEFVVLMPETDIDGAAVFSERLRKAIEAIHIRNKTGAAVKITASIGVSQWVPGERGEDLIQRSDMGVFEAKARGRNQVCMCPAPTPVEGIDPAQQPRPGQP